MVKLGNKTSLEFLIKRIKNTEQVFGLTSPLITTSNGKKMGKTAEGAVFLDAKLVSPYDFYQYWINIPDDDVFRLLSLLTFLPKEKIDGQTLMRIWSMSKIVTISLFMDLVEDKIVRLDDLVEKYIPEFSNLSVATDEQGTSLTLLESNTANMFIPDKGLNLFFN